VFEPPVAIHELPWFAALRKSQANFSLGLTELKDPTCVAAFGELASQAGCQLPE
jgi:hypothetical protein